MSKTNEVKKDVYIYDKWKSVEIHAAVCTAAFDWKSLAADL